MLCFMFWKVIEPSVDSLKRIIVNRTFQGNSVSNVVLQGSCHFRPLSSFSSLPKDTPDVRKDFSHLRDQGVDSTLL